MDCFTPCPSARLDNIPTEGELIVIPTEAERSGGICCPPRPPRWPPHPNPTVTLVPILKRERREGERTFTTQQNTLFRTTSGAEQPFRSHPKRTQTRYSEQKKGPSLGRGQSALVLSLCESLLRLASLLLGRHRLRRSTLGGGLRRRLLRRTNGRTAIRRWPVQGR